MSLPILVSQEKWQEFDDAWRALMTNEDPVDELLVALRLAGDRKRITRCVPLAREHAGLLTAGDRHADAARVLGAALIAGGNPGELVDELVKNVDAAWAGEDWYGPFCELTGLIVGSADMRKPWRAFAKLCTFKKGTLVYHPGGWGAGEVTHVEPTKLELDVRFWNGRSDTFPMNAAIDIFEPLSEEDLRARYFRDPENLRKQAKKEPLEILRRVVTTHHGRATTALIRNALMQIGIEGSAWSAWWRKARKLAENSEWFEVTGTPQKSVVSLLLTAKDPAESLRKALTRASGVAEVHAKVRDLFVGEAPDESLVQVGLELLATTAELEGEPLQDRLAAWLLLRERHGASLPVMVDALQDVMLAEAPSDPSVAPALWELFQALPGVKDQERAVDILPELFGDEWVEAVLPHLAHAAPGQVRRLVDKFVEVGRRDELGQHYLALLARPLRAPSLLVTLAALFEEGEPIEGFPTPAQRAQALMNLAANLYSRRRGSPQLTRVCTRLTDLLVKGPSPLLQRMLKNADANALRSIHLTVQRGVDPELDHLVTEIALDFDRHFFAGQSGPFWEGGAIWTTRGGLKKRSLELRELREVKIPENEESIGRAASYGDLSENAEWEAAMEEQRNLTSRAMAIEEELRLADLIEEAAIPEDTVCPGTIVNYREGTSEKDLRAIILGPWDDEEWNGVQVISYRAPLAKGLLGLHSGEKAIVELPSGELPVRVVSIESPEL